MPWEIGLFLAMRPEIDSVGERIHRLSMSSDKGAAEIDVFKSMLFRL